MLPSRYLEVEEVVKAKDYALAEAAKPVFGAAGFSIVVIAALIATASSINANLYAVTNVTYQLAKEGELTEAFGEPIAHSREELIISASLIIVLNSFLDLSEIAAVGSVTILLLHLVVHLGHLKLRDKTGASLGLILLAILTITLTIGFALVYAANHTPHIVWLVVASLCIAFISEFLLFKLTRRRIQPRVL